MRILLIEDDKDLCLAMALSLEKEGYAIDRCHNGADALLYLEDQVYDCLVLDRMLPGLDGLTVLELIRRKKIHTPVILATALSSLPDRIAGLDAGADDYLIKPFAIEELTARIRAVTRRPARLQDPASLSFGGLSLDPGTHELRLQDKTLTLSKRESALLSCFMKHPGQILPRPMLLSYVWGSGGEVEDGNLDNYIYFLRRRLKALEAPVKLSTLHGVGYRMEVLS